MNTAHQIQALEGLVNNMLDKDPGVFLVDIRIKPTNNIRVFLDADQGLSIDKCVTYNRALYKRIEESGMFPNGDFSLEVSSPGLDEPLKLHRQYLKNIGRKVEVMLQDGSKIEGMLKEVSDDGIVVEEVTGKGKKQEIRIHQILFEKIRHTRIAVVF